MHEDPVTRRFRRCLQDAEFLLLILLALPEP